MINKLLSSNLKWKNLISLAVIFEFVDGYKDCKIYEDFELFEIA